MPENKISVSDALDNLTGDAEAAIENHYGFDVYVEIARLANADDVIAALPVKATRALILGSLVSAGTPVEEAVKTAQGMRARDVLDYFGEDEPEADPDDPDTEAGKGGSSGATSKRSARSGA